MIWAALGVVAFLMVWLTIEIADEVRFVYGNGRIWEALLVSVLVVAVFAVTVWAVVSAADAYWAGS